MLKKTQLLSVAVFLTVILTACGVNQTPQPTYTPLPTYTPIPSPTITPTPQLKVLFYTDANTPDARWGISESANGRRFIDNGMYNIEILSANYNIWGSHKELETDGNFILDFDVSFVSDGISAGGVLFCYVDKDNWYRVLIHSDGRFLLDGVEDGTGFDFIPRTFTEAITRGTTTNHMRVEFREPQIVVYVNNIPTAMVMDTRFNSGSIRPFASAEQANTIVGFDNFLLTEAGPIMIPTLDTSSIQSLP